MAGTAFDSSAIGLAEFAIASNDPVVQKITYSLYMTDNVLQDIPFVTIPSMRMKGVRYTNLNGTAPNVNWRRIGAVPSVVKGKGTPYEEQVFILSDQLQIDRVEEMDQNAIEDPLQTQVDLFLANIKYECNYRFLLNDPTDPTNGNPDAWAGIKYRLDNPSIYQVPTEMKMNGVEGSGTTITATTAMTAAQANAFLTSFQCGLDRMAAPSGDGCVAYMNDICKRHLEMAIRTVGGGAGFDTTKDAFDRTVESWKGCKIRDIGRRADQTSFILAPETASGTPHATTTYTTTGQYTSIYFVRYGDSYFKGWQMNALAPIDLGIDPTNGVARNCVIDWPAGLWMPQNRCIARIFNIALT